MARKTATRVLIKITAAAALVASAGLSPIAASAGETRSSAALPKAGLANGKDRADSGAKARSDGPRRGPPGGFPDNYGQDQACTHANGNAPNHCNNDSKG